MARSSCCRRLPQLGPVLAGRLSAVQLVHRPAQLGHQLGRLRVVRAAAAPPPGRTPPGTARPRPAPPSDERQRSRRGSPRPPDGRPRTALEVCRSRLPNWVWYSVRSHSPIRACRSPARRWPWPNARSARTSRPCSRSSSGWSWLMAGSARASAVAVGARFSMAISRASRAWSARPSWVKVRVSRSAVRTSSVGGHPGGRVGLQLDQLAQRGGPVVVPRPQPIHRRVAGALGQRGALGQQRDLGPGQLRLGQELDQLGPGQRRTGLGQGPVGLAEQAGAEQHLRPVGPHHAPLEVRGPLVGHRHQLQGAGQVAGEELEPARGCAGRRRPGWAARTPRPAPARGRESALAAPMLPSRPCTSPRLIRILPWSTGGAKSSMVTATSSSASASASRPSRRNIAPRWAWISTRISVCSPSAARASALSKACRAAAASPSSWCGKARLSRIRAASAVRAGSWPARGEHGPRRCRVDVQAEGGQRAVQQPDRLAEAAPVHRRDAVGRAAAGTRPDPVPRRSASSTRRAGVDPWPVASCWTAVVGRGRGVRSTSWARPSPRRVRRSPGLRVGEGLVLEQGLGGGAGHHRGGEGGAAPGAEPGEPVRVEAGPPAGRPAAGRAARRPGRPRVAARRPPSAWC